MTYEIIVWVLLRIINIQRLIRIKNAVIPCISLLVHMIHESVDSQVTKHQHPSFNAERKSYIAVHGWESVWSIPPIAPREQQLPSTECETRYANLSYMKAG